MTQTLPATAMRAKGSRTVVGAQSVAPDKPRAGRPGLNEPEKQRARVAAKRFISRYRFEPNLFADEQLHLKLDPWQLEANDAVADYVRACYGEPLRVQATRAPLPWFTLRSPHGPGKTFWIAQLVFWFGSVFPDARIPCIAPKLDQLKTRLWLEMKKIRAGATADFQAMTRDIGAVHLRWFGEDTWTAFGQTATFAENLSGLHNERLLILIDEASGVDEGLFPTIFGALSTGKVVMLVMISNPSKKVGTFADSHLKPSVAKNFYRMHVALDKAPRVSRAWVAKMVSRYGATSPVVKIRCYGEFADDSPLQLVPTEHVLAAFEREVPPLEGLASKLRVSIDVADGGSAETVVTAAREYEGVGRVFLRVRRCSFASSVAPVESAAVGERIFEAFGGRKGVDEFVVDALGVGAGTAGVLMKASHRVVAHKGGEQSSDPQKWRNRRVQNYCACRDAYREGRVFFEADCFESDEDREEFQAQLASVTMNPGTDRVDDLVTKEQMVAEGLASPDIADSHSMQYSTAQSAGQGLADFTRLAAARAEKPNAPGAEKGRVTPLSATAPAPAAPGALNGGLGVKRETW